MTDSKTLLPQFEEQQFLNQDTKIEQMQEILNKFPQLEQEKMNTFKI